MERQIIIFEDDYKDYIVACDSIKQHNFDVKDSLRDFNKMKYALDHDSVDNSNFLSYVFDELKNNQAGLAGIVCAYNLSDNIKGDELIRNIRNYESQDSNFKEICQTVPIIGYSSSIVGDVSNGMKGAGANAFIHKDFIDCLGTTLQSELCKVKSDKIYNLMNKL